MLILMQFLGLLAFAAWGVVVLLTVSIGLAVVAAFLHSPFKDVVRATGCAWLVMAAVGTVSVAAYHLLSYLSGIPTVALWLL